MIGNHIVEILTFIADAFLHIWPYLLITIPLAVAVNMSGAAKHINRAFTARPVIAVLLATFVGAFSPFCSCGVIPVVAALLIGGVPLAPVMAFWIASPSMDPEAFFLSVSMIGFDLAVWRLGGTLVLSLSAGFVTLWFERRGWLGTDYIRAAQPRSLPGVRDVVRGAWNALKQRTQSVSHLGIVPGAGRRSVSSRVSANAQYVASSGALALAVPVSAANPATESGCGCGSGSACEPSSTVCADETGSTCSVSAPRPFRERLFSETWQATTMVIRFMLLAFFLEALIELYVPSEWITSVMGRDNPLAIIGAALLGVPVYTSNLAALPLIGGLLDQGMSPGAALAFLIAGPTTTLPAMAAVWGLVSRRVFLVYVSFSLVGAVILGYAYLLVSPLM